MLVEECKTNKAERIEKEKKKEKKRERKKEVTKLRHSTSFYIILKRANLCQLWNNYQQEEPTFLHPRYRQRGGTYLTRFNRNVVGFVVINVAVHVHVSLNTSHLPKMSLLLHPHVSLSP